MTTKVIAQHREKGPVMLCKSDPPRCTKWLTRGSGHWLPGTQTAAARSLARMVTNGFSTRCFALCYNGIPHSALPGRGRGFDFFNDFSGPSQTTRMMLAHAAEGAQTPKFEYFAVFS